MSDPFQIKNAEVEARLKELGEYLKGRMPAGMGFTLLMSDFGQGGAMFYVSSIERQSSLESMKEYLIKQGKLPQDGAVVSPVQLLDLGVEGEAVELPAVKSVQEAASLLVKFCRDLHANEARVRAPDLKLAGEKVGSWEVIVRQV